MTRLGRTAIAAAISISITIAGCALEGCACGAAPDAARAEDAAPPTPVRRAAVDRTPLRQRLITPGLVAPRETYELGFPNGGVVYEVAVDEGDAVEAGQILAALDATAARASLSQARAGMRHARGDLRRARTLVRGGSLPTTGLEDATTTARLARGDLALAGYAMRYSVIRAPEDGWVDVRLADPGEVVGPGQVVVRLASRSSGWALRIALADRVVARLSEGDLAEVRLDADPERAIAARVVTIARLPTPGSGTFDVDLEIGEPPGITLRTGLVGRASIPIGEAAPASVPLSAVVSDRDRAGAVFAIEGDRVRRVSVGIAFLVGDRAAIAEGLDGIDAVVASGAERLEDGARIALTEE
jgi:RND family efflux transporter MFP subunit